MLRGLVGTCFGTLPIGRALDSQELRGQTNAGNSFGKTPSAVALLHDKTLAALLRVGK